MWKASLIAAAVVLAPVGALAGGTVVKALRPELRTFDAHGQPTGMTAARHSATPKTPDHAMNSSGPGSWRWAE